jgi:Flp pilus assembly protein TadB
MAVSSTIISNMYTAITNLTQSEREKPLRELYSERLVNSVDSISYTILKLTLQIFNKKPYDQPLFSDSETNFPKIQKWLDQADRSETAEQYMARSVVFIVIGTFSGLFLGGFIGTLLYPTLQNVELVLIGQYIPADLLIFFDSYGYLIVATLGSLIFATVFSTTVLSITYLYAWNKAREVKRSIDINFNNGIAHMYALAEGGADINTMIEKMAQTQKTTGKFAIEFRKIKNIIEYERENITTALQIQAKRTPSNEMEDLLKSLKTIQESGTKATQILESKHKDVLQEKESNADNIENTLELLNEIILNGGLLPIFLVILILVQSLQGETPVQTLNMLTYGAPFGLLIIFGGFGYIILQDESKSEKVIDISRRFYEPHTQVSKIPTVVSERVRDEERNKQHLTDPNVEKMLDRWKKQDSRLENIYKPLFDIRGRPLAALPYTLILTLVYFVVVFSTIGLPEVQAFNTLPFRTYLYYILLPLTVFLTPSLFIHTLVARREKKIGSRISVIIDTAINSMKTGESFEESLNKVDSNMTGFFGSDPISDTLSKTGNNIQWKHDRIYALTQMANDFQVPRMTQTIKLITDSKEFTSDLVPVLNIERQNIEKDREVKKRIKSAGLMAGIIIIIVAFMTEGILVLMDVSLIQTLQGAATGGGQATAQSGQSIGFNPETFDIFRAKFVHLSVNMSFVFGSISAFIWKRSIYSGLKMGLLLSYLSLASYALIVFIIA